MVALKKYRTYLKDFMEKQKDYEVWINKDMHDNWLNEFHETEVSERKINLMVMCQYLNTPSLAIMRTLRESFLK